MPLISDSKGWLVRICPEANFSGVEVLLNVDLDTDCLSFTFVYFVIYSFLADKSTLSSISSGGLC